MKINHILQAALMLLLLYACQNERDPNSAENNAENSSARSSDNPPVTNETPPKLIDVIVGDWRLEGGSQSGDRLTFTVEARYHAYSNGRPIDSGAYRMNEQLRNLYLESEISKQVKEYEVDLNDGTLKLVPKTDKTIVYSYRKVDGR